MIVCQWNSHHGGKRSDDKLDTAGFGTALRRINADVYCLNEVEQFDGYGNDDKVAKWVAALGPGWSGFFANLSGVISGHGQGNAILARTADVDGQPMAKSLYDSRVAIGLKIKGVTIVATHLDDQKPTSRIVEMVQLLGWASVSPLIISADWNAHPDALEMAPMRTLFKDAWTTSGSVTSFNGTGYTKSSRIDAIFYRGVTAISCDVPDTRVNGIYPSDHYPVVATFR